MKNDFLHLNPKTLPERGTPCDWDRFSGADQTTIRKACLLGQLRHELIGGHRLIEKADFLGWFASDYRGKGRPRKAQKEVSATP
jgi:hypothetical protein